MPAGRLAGATPMLLAAGCEATLGVSTERRCLEKTSPPLYPAVATARTGSRDELTRHAITLRCWSHSIVKTIFPRVWPAWLSS